MGEFLRHESCPACGSSDNLARYDDGSAFCFGCEYVEKENKSMRKGEKMQEKNNKSESKELKPIITTETAQDIKSKTKSKGLGYRGIKDEVLLYFGVRTEYSDDGEISAVYYPITYESELSGYKIRKHPKIFSSIGRTGAECDLFGQFRYKTGGRICLLVGGEHDQLAAYQILREYQLSRGKDQYDPPVVVSPTVGETSAKKQIANHYSFFDQFEKIIIAFDNDKAGKEATEKIIPVLPKNKVYIMEMRHKDPNEYLLKSDSAKFINEYYSAKKYVPLGVVGSNEISNDMRQELSVEKIPLPPFMWKLQEMMPGGIPLGRIVNLGSASGTGKSTIVDEIIYYEIFNCPHRFGIVTLESTCGQYGIKLLSRHIGKKIELLPNDQALELLESEEVKKKEYELFNTESGDPRFYLVDNRDGDVEDIKGAIENLIISCECKVVVLDPIHDIVASLSLEEQEDFDKWLKGMIKSHGVTFLNVCHTRKTGGGQKAGSTGADLHEEDIMGSSSLYKSAACNLMFGRDKENEDYIVRNTTTMKATKIRWTGKTGIAGKYFYDIETHTMHDLDDFLQNNPQVNSDF